MLDSTAVMLFRLPYPISNIIPMRPQLCHNDSFQFEHQSVELVMMYIIIINYCTKFTMNDFTLNSACIARGGSRHYSLAKIMVKLKSPIFSD